MIVKRNIFDSLVEDISKKHISVLLGTRQVGKTTLLRELEKVCKKKNIEAHFFDLEQPKQLLIFNKSDQEIIDHLSSLKGVVFIDEFQYIKNASKLLKAIVDSKKGPKLFVSGSSSLEIHKHLKESLAGRKRIYMIYPLTFLELRNHIELPELYFKYGSLPGLLHEDTHKKKLFLLDEILKSYVLKDVKSLIKEENIRAFNHMMYLLAENQGQLVALSSLSREIGLSMKAVNHYFEILTETYIIHPLHCYSTNQGNELKKSMKIFLYDLGIRNALLQDFSSILHRDDIGKILETSVYLNLLPYLLPNMDLRFWRTRSDDEVDFIFVKDRKPIPIEVKKSWKQSGIPKGMRLFFKRYASVKQGFMITLDPQPRTITDNGKEVNIYPLQRMDLWLPAIIH